MSGICTIYEWISVMEQISPAIASLGLKKTLSDERLNADAFNFANDQAHRKAIASAFQNISTYEGYHSSAIALLGTQLFGRQTDGAYGELFVYDWLVRTRLPATMQITLTAKDVLCGNGSELDGVFDLHGNKIYFDVKSFGLSQRIVEALKKRLEALLPERTVFVEESWDVPVTTLQELASKARRIAQSLQTRNCYRDGRILIRVAPKKPVSTSSRELDPYLLAEQNATYPLRYAHKFTRSAPFILIFVIHPWLGGLDLHHDFADYGSIFTRSLARRVFMQFRADAEPVQTLARQVLDSTSIAESTRLLSGLLFLNAWPEKSATTTDAPPSWFYANPRAVHPIDAHRFLSAIQGSGVGPLSVDDFRNDVY